MPTIDKNKSSPKAVSLSARPDTSEYGDRPENGKWRERYQDMEEPEFEHWLNKRHNQD